MSVIKANGCLKTFLRNAAYTESLYCVVATAIIQDWDARYELMRCRQGDFKVGDRVCDNVPKSKLASLKVSHATPLGSDNKVYSIKAHLALL